MTSDDHHSSSSHTDNIYGHINFEPCFSKSVQGSVYREWNQPQQALVKLFAKLLLHRLSCVPKRQKKNILEKSCTLKPSEKKKPFHFIA